MQAKKNPPRHVAIIMDGNGRWAAARGWPRYRGHMAGVRRVEEIAKVASDMGIEVVTFFAFSTENWSRPKTEVSVLMKTLSSVLTDRLLELKKNNIRLHFTGRREDAPEAVLNSIDKAIRGTKSNTGMILNLAFYYGARTEILDAVKAIAKDAKKGTVSSRQIDETLFSQYLYTAGLPDPDLLIRTSGERRISNFLLWQMSYTEIYFTSVLWPDFDEKEFCRAIADFEKRDRRFGKV